MTANDQLSYETAIGISTPTSITLLDRDLADELIGHVGFGELAFWLVSMRRPTAQQSKVFEAVLVALADHGLTPTAISARLTYYSAPDSVQGALAAGLLGGGSRFLGVTEDCGKMLATALAMHGEPTNASLAAWDQLATTVMAEHRSARVLVPGLGHPHHKDGDPRTPRLLKIARENDCVGPHLELFTAIGRVAQSVLGKPLALNGAGVCGAILADLGFPSSMLRGFALLARSAGLLGHIAEEERTPIAPDIYEHVDSHASYRTEA